MTSDPAAGAGLALDPEEADAVAVAASGYAAALPPDRAAPYQALARAAADGWVPDDLVAAAERVTAVSLQTGRARRDGYAAAERLLAAVYRRTSAGQALASRMQDVNQALTAFAGRQLRTARAAATAPGCYTLTLEADSATVTLTIDAAGINVRSLHVG